MPRAIQPAMARILRSQQLGSRVKPTPGVVSGSMHIVCRVDFYDYKDEHHLLTTSPYGSAPRAKLVDWNISTSSATDIAGTGNLTFLVDTETAGAVIPLIEKAPLSPVAAIKIFVRFHAPDEPSNFTNYGMYEIKDTNIQQTAGGIQIEIEIADNSRRVQRARFYRFESIPAKTPYVFAFQELLEEILPQSHVIVASTYARTGLLTFDVQADRLSAVKEMATAISYQIDWNWYGIGTVFIGPDIDSVDPEYIEPVWRFTDGGDAVATVVNRNLTDERSYNGVIAMGESSGSDKPPVRAEAWDLDPTSPTYFDPNKPEASPYGPVPFFYVSEFITTIKQARNAAQARLPKVKGLVEVLELNTAMHPGIVPNDPILVERPEIGVTGLFIVESVDLSPTGAKILCRDRRVSA